MQAELLKTIVNDYVSGCSLKKLSYEYGYSIGNLHYHLKKRNVLRKNHIVHAVQDSNPLFTGLFAGLWAGDGSKFRDGWNYVVKIHMNKNDAVLLKLIENLVFRIFAKKISYFPEIKTNRGAVVVYSKFIYNFFDNYLAYERNKTLTVRLRNKIAMYDFNFLRGFLLGLTLSDGYIKERFVFSSISKLLAKNAFSALKFFGFEPSVYFQVRRYREHKQFRIVLGREQTRLFKIFLQNVVNDYGFNATLDQLKSYAQ